MAIPACYNYTAFIFTLILSALQSIHVKQAQTLFLIVRYSASLHPEPTAYHMRKSAAISFNTALAKPSNPCFIHYGIFISVKLHQILYNLCANTKTTKE